MTITAAIAGIGLNCPLGQGLDAVAAGYRNGRPNFAKSKRGPIGTDGAPVTLSSAIPFEEVRNFEVRLQQLFAGAVADPISTTPIAVPVPLRLVLPAWLAQDALGAQLRGWIGETYCEQFGSVEILADGETVAVYELARGMQHVSEGHADRLVVGALDSFMAPELLDLLAIQERILSKGKPHGLIPGEAAALFMLAPMADETREPMLGTMVSIFTGFEQEDLNSPRGMIGKGLAKPLRQAFESFVPERFLVDLNGERWRSEDIGFALSGARMPDELRADFETPIGLTGDCGAVNSLILAALSLAPGTEPAQPNIADEETMRCISVVSTSLWQGPRSVAVFQSFHGRGSPT